MEDLGEFLTKEDWEDHRTDGLMVIHFADGTAIKAIEVSGYIMFETTPKGPVEFSNSPTGKARNYFGTDESYPYMSPYSSNFESIRAIGINEFRKLPNKEVLINKYKEQFSSYLR